jgi:hypothetical protein
MLTISVCFAMSSSQITKFRQTRRHHGVHPNVDSKFWDLVISESLIEIIATLTDIENTIYMRQ